MPIGVAAIALTLSKLAESRASDAEPVDWPGVAAFSASLFLLVFGLVRGNAEGWSSFQITGSLAGAAVLMATFVAIEARSSHPMLDLGLFRKSAFVGVSIVAFCLSASMFAMFLYLTIYVQDVLGFTPFEAGVRFLPITLVAFFVAPVAGQLLTRIPARAFFGAGLTLVGVGLLLMRGLQPSTVTAEGSGWTALLAGFIVAGAGIGMTNPAIASVAVGVVPAVKAGMGSGINNTFRQVGIATGIAALGAIFQSEIASKLHELLPGSPDGLAEAVASSGTRAVDEQGAPASAAASAAFVGALNELLLIGGILALVGAALGLLLTRERDLVPQGAPAEDEVAAEPAAS